MKQCKSCSETKDLTAFSLSESNLDGLRSICKSCVVNVHTQRQRTIKGLVKKIYHNQRMTTKKMGRPTPSYTEAELLEWMMGHGYLAMWQTWTDAGHVKWLSPSVDRKDNTKSYSLDNIQLTTWRENLDNQKCQNISGKYLHTFSKSVDQLDLQGNFIQTFQSIAIATRAINNSRIGASNISSACTGKLKTAYGFRWRFSNALS